MLSIKLIYIALIMQIKVRIFTFEHIILNNYAWMQY